MVEKEVWFVWFGKVEVGIWEEEEQEGHACSIFWALERGPFLF